MAEYDTLPDVVVRAPGVIKLLGEHTVQCEGLMLAIASGFSMNIAVSRRKDSAMRFYAADYNERKRTTIPGLKYKKEDRWANYIKTPLALLAESGLVNSGYSFTISGNIPQQLGFSSSNAIILASFIAMRNLLDLSLPDEELKRLFVKASQDFLGQTPDFVETAVGIASQRDTAIMADLKSNRYSKVPFHFEGYSYVITDSKVPRFNVEPELKLRQSECLRCIALLSRKKKEVRSIRDCSLEDLSEAMGSLPESIRRRSTFVAEEIVRVKEAEEALRRSDSASFARAMLKSQDGLRDLYEISCPEIDWLVKRALELDGCLGSRMVGKGFGGCTFSIIRSDMLQEYKKRLEEYERIFGFRASVMETEAGNKAGLEE